MEREQSHIVRDRTTQFADTSTSDDEIDTIQGWKHGVSEVDGRRRRPISYE